MIDPIPLRLRFKAMYAELVVLATLPVYLGAVGLYGLKVLAVLALSVCTGIVFDVMARRLGDAVYTRSTWPIWFVVPLAFPPGAPLWLVPLAVGFALLFGCLLFGGYGRSLFPVAAMAIVFLSLGYPAEVNILTKPFADHLAGFSTYASQVPVSNTVFSDLNRFADVSPKAFFHGLMPGNIGESYAGLLIGIGLLFLLVGILDPRFVFSAVSTTVILSFYGHTAYPQQVLSPVFQMLAGGFLVYLVFFVSSDPFALPRTPEGRWIGGFLFGLFT
ncbi:MAG TPA: RnfABCDGE type electron transport complex subunit D, partial [Candidatus Ozemobacteraceae bacterium]|nr:RnfABCDGE type electron transport complex subunit D [Candidatus Ozemobacteraceae bacterium]